MTEKIDTLKNKKSMYFFLKCLCNNSFGFFTLIMFILILMILMIYMFTKIIYVKKQLESCRSSRILE